MVDDGREKFWINDPLIINVFTRRLSFVNDSFSSRHGKKFPKIELKNDE